ncbi:MAG: LCP family protein [Nocardioides sp.]|jgi:LCP family protein required for cell wall assembly
MRARIVRRLVLAVMLGVAVLSLPDSTQAPTDVELVRIRAAQSVGASDRVVWILAVGSDARPGQPMNRSHGDALQLVGINPRTRAATAIGVPRDSWVTIPGHGRNKINSALVFGGPKAMAAAVSRLIGITPDYVFVSRFEFFEQMVDDIGGISVQNPRTFSDPYLRKRGFRQGRIRLNGFEAMAFSRIRKSLPRGDFDRSANQQRTLRGIHRRIHSNAKRPGFIDRGVLTVLQHTSTNLRPGELFRLAQLVAQVEPGKITTCVIGGGVGWVGPQSVVFPDVLQARRLGRDARRDARISRC